MLRTIVAVSSLCFSAGAAALTGGHFNAQNYMNLADAQTQIISVDIDMQTSPNDPDFHHAIGLRGRSLTDTLPLGRGITIGNVGQDQDGNGTKEVNCAGVMVEDFTYNYYTSEGLIPGTCVPYTFAVNGVYRFSVHASYTNVYWAMYKRRYDLEIQQYVWDFETDGGCLTTAAVLCYENPYDGNYAEYFIGSTGLTGTLSWSYTNLGSTHY